MSVEIWKGVCSGPINGVYETEVHAKRQRNVVYFYQAAADDDHDTDQIVMSESEAIDIALCILAELAPGMFYNLKKED